MTLFTELKKTFGRQRVITHSWEIIVFLPNTLGAGIVGSELIIKNVLKAFGSIQLRYIQVRL